ncbi:LLM class flavin-dependent oxidoreductase [Frankia sp. AgB1.9]|nr:LLM class flavin-dependent oxidoreductase [Frankia sp. AgW1.1]MBL7549371.1 LLM class flavin-dependent oxidoreductase [Frankia sp. AgB1.9]MBL7623404.1 LLM class flavin-dependent oxidoreductase [Frankia sp. AgB1.8]
MPDAAVPLSVLDLAPLVSGSTPAEALRNCLDLAREAERLGYTRFWLAEHHLTPGVTSAVPSVLIGAVATATERIRVGSGAVLTGHHTPVGVAEQFGLLAHLHPGRIDLGIGRSNLNRLAELASRWAAGSPTAGPAPSDPAAEPPGVPAPDGKGRIVDGLLIPNQPKGMFTPERLPRILEQAKLVGHREDEGEDYPAWIGAIQALFRGDARGSDGQPLRSPATEGADARIWVLASSPGDSARTAGELGLPLGANYHVAPWGVLDTVAAYRAAFRPSAELDRPYVLVSADVVVGDDDAHAAELARGYGAWVLSIRAGEGAMPYPSAAEAAAKVLTDAERALVADRVDSQFVGGPETVVQGLRALVAATGADELLVTTITHDHADRVRSYELLAKAWAQAV